MKYSEPIAGRRVKKIKIGENEIKKDEKKKIVLIIIIWNYKRF